MGRIVSIYVSGNGSYVDKSNQKFELESGDLFIWHNCIMQVDDVYNPQYDGGYSSMSSPIKCSIKSVLSDAQFFHTDSGLYAGKIMNFPLEFVAVAVGHRYVEPPPPPPPSPPPPDTDKFKMMAT